MLLNLTPTAMGDKFWESKRQQGSAVSFLCLKHRQPCGRTPMLCPYKVVSAGSIAVHSAYPAGLPTDTLFFLPNGSSCYPSFVLSPGSPGHQLPIAGLHPWLSELSSLVASPFVPIFPPLDAFTHVSLRCASIQQEIFY